ncbi:MAG TPA: ChaN family lipoprotein [Pseudomonas sp.]
MRCLFAILALLSLSACQGPPPLPNIPLSQSPPGREDLGLGMIHEIKSGQEVTPQQLVERLSKASRVLVGEQHDNPDHHALQLWLLHVLADRRPQGSLLLEMINPDQQASVDATRAAIARADYPQDLTAALHWQKGWDWAQYGPIVRYAIAQPYPLLSANLDTAEVMSVYKQPPVQDGNLSAAPGVREKLLDQVRASHCGLLPEDQLPAMVAIQQMRDRRMAERLMAAPAPALLFAGNWHVRKDVGVPLHMADLGVEEAPVVLILAEVGALVESASADYVWYTAATPDQDYCAQMRKPSAAN